MPEHDNDKLEQFFKKAASKPDIVFNEDDWKKLEARLDAQPPPPLSGSRNTLPRITAAVLLALLFVAGSFNWTKDESAVSSSNKREALILSRDDHEIKVKDNTNLQDNRNETAENSEIGKESKLEPTNVSTLDELAQPDKNRFASGNAVAKNITRTFPAGVNGGHTAHINLQDIGIPSKTEVADLAIEQRKVVSGVTLLGKNTLQRELLNLSIATAEEIKQMAGGQLPGAKEEDGLNNKATVEAEKAPDENTILASPRLSLLLSLAPDFSSTSMNHYTSAGAAFGAMIHYHIRNSWSISAGIIRSKKKYTGAGEDYQPPKGYWKYYTNGVVPETIDGSCNILEVPVMVQYTLAQTGRSRFLIGTGVSSYLMLNESYEYNFEQPNPGAKDRWDSKNGSKFFLNMINFSVGYERQITPGLLIGIEPYLKIPIEEIGWTKLRLFSTGASFTLRYRIINKNRSLVTRSRSPD